MLSGAPFKRCSRTGRVRDRAGEEVKLIGATRKILQRIASDQDWQDVQIAYVSRTEHPAWAKSCLKMFYLNEDATLDSLGKHKHIYPGSKATHFRRIQQETGLDYAEMIFFDNEKWNCRDVEPLGVTCVYTPSGLTEEVWDEGLKQFAERASRQQPSRR
uniref:Magnesium-dependent phosphatase 1 n=1 Tax=Tetraselmis sp. GSL018 TaxID=582737 RepID=A0A061SGL5_9CHLO|mmetsp:Transcript_12958/g.30739  ORF Transcript_12958/g.30739 Transcript_12958/m.30739 type:complete len:159 (+) Transcript_12958:473-949(+)